MLTRLMFRGRRSPIATLTMTAGVSYNPNTQSTYIGFFPPRKIGNITPKSFTYKGTTYTVQNWYWEDDSGHSYLEFNGYAAPFSSILTEINGTKYKWVRNNAGYVIWNTQVFKKNVTTYTIKILSCT